MVKSETPLDQDELPRLCERRPAVYTRTTPGSSLSADDKARLRRIVARMLRKEAEETRLRELRIREKRKRAIEIVEHLVRRFRAMDETLVRVVLFGSLARDELTNERFDIDLAAESDRYLDLLGAAMEAEIDVDLIDLRHAGVHIRGAVDRINAGARAELDFAALGYTIHNIYCLIENYALGIAKSLENEIDPASWHRELIERMSVEIATVRPALWDRALAAAIDELRRFRHAFRNLYANDIDPEWVLLIQKRLPAIVSGIRSSHASFVEKLDYMITTADTPDSDSSA